MTETPDTREELLAEARSAFAFLEQRGTRVERAERADMSVLAYVDDPATFEVEFDWREESVLLLVCRTVDRQRPGGYYMHEGRRVRVHLIEALRETGLLDESTAARLRASTAASGVPAMRSQVELLASTLRDSLDALRARVGVVFGHNRHR